MLTAADWHNRFKQQARWTEPVRRFLFKQVELEKANKILEVGCGTGAIVADLSAQTSAQVYGIDFNMDYLRHASRDRAYHLACADAFRLPFPDQVFEIVCCHYFLLWIVDTGLALGEMKRVAKPGGFILALAEPDYGGRIDYPDAMSRLGQLQIQALEKQGADPFAGRKIKGLFRQAGLKNVQAGVLGGQWNDFQDPSGDQTEWDILRADLQGMIDDAEFNKLKQVEKEARRIGEHILYVPTFYALGQV